MSGPYQRPQVKDTTKGLSVRSRVNRKQDICRLQTKDVFNTREYAIARHKQWLSLSRIRCPGRGGGGTLLFDRGCALILGSF